MENEAFYATCAQVLPVLLLATVLELSYSRTKVEKYERRERENFRRSDGTFNIDRLDAFIEELESHARPTWWDKPSQWLARLSYSLPVLYAVVATGLCMAVLGEILEPSSLIRNHVLLAIGTLLFSMSVELVRVSRGEYEILFSMRSRASDAATEMRDLRARLVEQEQQRGALDSERESLADDTKQLGQMIKGLESQQQRLDVMLSRRPSGEDHHGTDSESTSEPEGEEYAGIDSDESGSSPGDRQ